LPRGSTHANDSDHDEYRRRTGRARAARRSRRNVHELAEEILKTRVTPDYIRREIGHLLEDEEERIYAASRRSRNGHKVSQVSS